MHQVAGAVNFSSDRGAGTVTAVGIFLSSLWLVGLTISSASLAVQQVRLQVLADTIAVASSDTLIGLVAGLPCESAQDLAVASLVDLHQCSIVGESVHIALMVKSLGIVLNAEAFAEQQR